MKICPSCKASIIDEARFCNKCGSSLDECKSNGSEAVYCISCGKKLPSDSVFCLSCGAKQPNESNNIDFSALDSLSTGAIYESEGLKVENGVLLSYVGKRRNVTVPGTVDEIFDGAFANNGIVSVIEIREGVKVIGKGAFFHCSCLERLVIPASVEKIYDDSFYGIFFGTSLSTLVLPKIDIKLIKRALSEIGNRYFDENEISDFVSYGTDCVEIDIKAIEKRSDIKHKAYEAARLREQEEARRIAEEKRRKEAEEARLRAEAEAKRRKEEEAKRKAEQEARRKAAEEARRKAELAKWVVGGNPTFGSYYKDSRYSKSDIEWTVLAKEGNKALIISKYVIECISYNSYESSVTWESCSLRKWLNKDFITSAFTCDEAARILSTNLINPGNEFDSGVIYRTDGGNPTTDKVFILSKDEIYKYNFDTQGEATPYARGRGVLIAKNGKCLYWVRQPGVRQSEAMVVDMHGSVWIPDIVNSYIRGVRPAMWVSLD